jgi:hypothetical protein
MQVRPGGNPREAPLPPVFFARVAGKGVTSRQKPIHKGGSVIGIQRVYFLELGFGEQGTENMFGVMSRGARGDHLVKGGADQRICLNLSFNG